MGHGFLTAIEYTQLRGHMTLEVLESTYFIADRTLYRQLETLLAIGLEESTTDDVCKHHLVLPIVIKVIVIQT